MKRIIIFTTVLFMLSTKFHAQEITMFPGFWGPKYYQNSDPVSISEVGKLMKDVPYANAEWKKSKAQMTGAWVAAGAQFGFLFWQLNKISNNERGTPQLIGNIACGVIGIGLSLASSNSRKKAILVYNKYSKEGKENSYFFAPSTSGIGIAMQF